LQTFKQFIREAYSFFPKNEDEIRKELATFPHDNVEEIIALFNFLKDKDASPINIDMKKPKNVNVTRALKGTYTVDDISKGAGLNIVKIKFGNGSLGNRGANNRGNAFEKDFKEALDGWYAGENNPNFPTGETLTAVQDIIKTYDLADSEWTVKVVGGENTRRPLSFKGDITLTNTKGTGLNIGDSVTDITIKQDSGKEIYLSLKIEKTTTFFNVGVKTKITKKEIDEGEIKNSDGKKLLDLFGIDNKRFCTIFNPNVKTESGKVVTKPNTRALKKLLASGIGYGYHVIHKKGGKIESYKMDRKLMANSASVGNVTIYYGGKKGSGKRIDMEMQSPHYKFKLNIRDTQGGDGYPTRMMCDFTKI
tara:strand:- start:192 stop:1283 length:1092 start_codon:yes stop_codon:yes gene_type:complete